MVSLDKTSLGTLQGNSVLSGTTDHSIKRKTNETKTPQLDTWLFDDNVTPRMNLCMLHEAIADETLIP